MDMYTTSKLDRSYVTLPFCRGIAFLSLVGMVYCTSSPPTEQESSDMPNEHIILFDGTSFDGWEGDLNHFRIEEEAIVAGSMEQDIPTNKFLCTDEVFENFELSLQVKFPSENNNGGIQIHSERIANHHEVIGYQIDVDMQENLPFGLPYMMNPGEINFLWRLQKKE